MPKFKRDIKKLDRKTGRKNTIKTGIPHSSEGQNGDITLRRTPIGHELFAKIDGMWYGTKLEGIKGAVKSSTHGRVVRQVDPPKVKPNPNAIPLPMNQVSGSGSPPGLRRNTRSNLISNAVTKDVTTGDVLLKSSKSSTASPNIKLLNESAGGTGVNYIPTLQFIKSPESGVTALADDDSIGLIAFFGDDDNTTDGSELYSTIRCRVEDVTHATKKSSLQFSCLNSGTTLQAMTLSGTDLNIMGDLTVGGGDISGPVDGSLTIKADTDLIFQVDSDNDGTETFQFKNGAGTEICTISEDGIVTAALSGIFTSGVTITGYNNLPAGLAMNADNNDDNGDSWYFLAYNNDTFSFTNNKSGSYVEVLGMAANATAADTVITTAGKLKVGGNVIQASDGGDAITLDTDDNVTAGASFISGGSLYLPKAAAALTDLTNKGQLWVKNTSPNELWYTEPGGTDIQITSGTSVAGSSPIQIASITINESDMNALHTTEQTIIAAQGANKIIMPTSGFLIIDRDASTAQSSSTADLFISYDGATSLSEVIYYQRRFMYNESGDRILHLQHYTGEVAQSITDGENKPLTVKLDAAITSGSIDSMKVVVSYHVFDNS